MKRIYKRIVLIPVIFMLVFGNILAFAGEGSYAKKKDGGAGLEIGISGDNKLMLEEEKVSFDFSLPGLEGEGIGDVLNANVHSVYRILNSDSRDAYAAVGVVRFLKIKEEMVKRSEEDSFRSQESIIVNDESVSGLIWPVDTREHIIKNSAYDTFSEALDHMELGGYFEEAFSHYGITSFTDHEERVGASVSKMPKSEYRKLYRVAAEDEEGEEKLCIVVYNLYFKPQETKVLEVNTSFLGSMERPTSRSELGTLFNFTYNGGSLESFYVVKDISIALNIPKDERLGLDSCDASYYMNDGIPTIRSSGVFSGFKLTLGKKASDEEIYDQMLESGFWRHALDAVGAATVVGLILAVVCIIITVKKRRKSGIGMQL